MKLKMASKITYLHVIYAVVACIELLVVHQFSDLKPSLGNWESKALQILNLEIPDDNFYGPGSALMLIPFLWNGPSFYFGNIFYFFLGTFFYSKICTQIEGIRYQNICRFLLLLNPYLFWLADSSQDTVFEYFLLMACVWFLINKSFYCFSIFGILLAMSRSQYWLFIIMVSLVFIFKSYKGNKKIKFKFLFPLLSFFAITFFNVTNYDSPSPALEGGVTLELAYSPYYYLGHPKFDIDYFLDGSQGPLLSSSKDAPTNLSAAELNTYYTKKALTDAYRFPQQTLMGLLQKIDSYIFTSQKVPNANGYFKLDSKNNVIVIENERLSWPLVIGNLVYAATRGGIFLLFIFTLGLYLVSKRSKELSEILPRSYGLLIIPWFTNLVVCSLVYTETRFKLVGELLIVPFAVGIFLKFIEFLQKTPALKNSIKK